MARLSLAAPVLLFSLAGCHHGTSSGPPTVPATPLVLAAGMEGLFPTDEAVSYDMDLQRLGIVRVDSVYKLTTPADEPFSFDVLTRAVGNEGSVRVSLSHVADGHLVAFGHRHVGRMHKEVLQDLLHGWHPLLLRLSN